jgi:hypothetical protein
MMKGYVKTAFFRRLKVIGWTLRSDCLTFIVNCQIFCHLQLFFPPQTIYVKDKQVSKQASLSIRLKFHYLLVSLRFRLDRANTENVEKTFFCQKRWEIWRWSLVYSVKPDPKFTISKWIWLMLMLGQQYWSILTGIVLLHLV